ncbi:MAG: signal peptidase I [Opitutales bacterium]
MAFPFKNSGDKKLRKEARHLAGLANKVLHYRRDVLDPDRVTDIRNATDHLLELADQKPIDVDELRSARQRLERLLERSGGKIYPVTFFSENVEILLVAAILAIGIRSFFIQPFKIPTNSMWPTYAGMTAEVYNEENPRPGLPMHIAEVVFRGAGGYTVEAPASGELLIPTVREGNGLRLHFMPEGGRKYFVWPSQFRRYEFEVGGVKTSVRLPLEFPLDGVFMESLLEGWVADLPRWQWRLSPYFLRKLYMDSLQSVASEVPGGDLESQLKAAQERGILPRSFNEQMELAKNRGLLAREERLTVQTSTGPSVLTVYWLRVFTREGELVRLEEGAPILDFDILTGDMLFVDRFSYHFTRPAVGDPFVFETRDIEGLVVNGVPDDKYYIKRLVGQGGDSLEVQEPVLLRNGQPITGSPVFEREFVRTDDYRGYMQAGWLSEGLVESIPEDFFYAMGDNSPESSDSRLWGLHVAEEPIYRRKKRQGNPINFVPKEAVVGQALFIFYPFSSRWGPAE